MQPKKSNFLESFRKFFLTPEARSARKSDETSVELSKAHGQAHGTNRLLSKWFDQTYRAHLKAFHISSDPTVELGSGGSKFKDIYPDLFTSDVLSLPGIDGVVDAMKMPFSDGSIANLTLINVLHHIRRPLDFFKEAHRVLKPGGRLVFTEPYVSCFSYPIYKFIHHEPCDLKNNILSLPDDSDALLDSNQAIPTQIIFKHWDKVIKVAPRFRIDQIRFHSSLSYFLSGGVNYKIGLPLSVWSFINFVDRALCKVMGRYTASFFTVVITKAERSN